MRQAFRSSQPALRAAAVGRRSEVRPGVPGVPRRAADSRPRWRAPAAAAAAAFDPPPCPAEPAPD